MEEVHNQISAHSSLKMEELKTTLQVFEKEASWTKGIIHYMLIYGFATSLSNHFELKMCALDGINSTTTNCMTLEFSNVVL